MQHNGNCERRIKRQKGKARRMDAIGQIAANAQEIKRLKAALKHTAREREMELVFLRQAIKGRELREALGDKPQAPWKGLDHNHICEYCNETWRCDCDTHLDYVVKDHGCVEQGEAMRRMIGVLNSPDKWQAPYLSRYAKPRKPSKDDTIAAQIAANENEIRRLRKELRQ
jgi:hypothetical protein